MRQQIRRDTSKADYTHSGKTITDVLDDRFDDKKNLEKSRRHKRPNWNGVHLSSTVIDQGAFSFSSAPSDTTFSVGLTLR